MTLLMIAVAFSAILALTSVMLGRGTWDEALRTT
jgi:hypothetical protein